MIEANIWKYWIMKQIVTKFGSLKIDNDGDTMMSSDANCYCKNFRQVHLLLTTVDHSFGQLSYRFLYSQNKLYHEGCKYSQCRNLFHGFILPNINENQMS